MVKYAICGAVEDNPARRKRAERRISLKKRILLIFLSALLFLSSCEAVRAGTDTDTEHSGDETETSVYEENTQSPSDEDKPLPTDPELYEEIPYEDALPVTETSEPFELSGTLRSATGTSLELIIEWRAVRKRGEAFATFVAEVSISHKALVYPSAMGTLSIGDKNFVFRSPYYEYYRNTADKSRVYSVSTDIPCEAGETVKLGISARWNFSGTYENTDIDAVTVGGYVPVGEKYASLERSASLETNVILQNPELPEGCEVTSLAILLNYLGFDVSHTYLADNYLPIGEAGEASYYEYNLGNPRNAGQAWGCYAPVILRTANDYLAGRDTDYRAYDYTGCDASELYMQVQTGNPVIVWITMGFAEPYTKSPWTVDGEKLYWKYPLHCVVLCGYDFDAGTVTLADPLKAELYKKDMKLFELRWQQMEAQAVVIKHSRAKSS